MDELVIVTECHCKSCDEWTENVETRLCDDCEEQEQNDA